MSESRKTRLRLAQAVLAAGVLTVTGCSDQFSGKRGSESIEAQSLELKSMALGESKHTAYLDKYFGINEEYTILLSPSDSMRLFKKEGYGKYGAEFEGVKNDFLIETPDNVVYGFNPASGMLYDKGSTNVHTGKNPLEQLLAIKSTLQKAEDLPSELIGTNGSGKVHELKNAKKLHYAKKLDETAPLSQEDIDYLVEAKEKAKDIGQQDEKIDQPGQNPKVSDDELKKIIDAEFKPSSDSQKTKDSNEVVKEPVDPPKVSSSEKVADIEKLREELKARLQKDFGHIPNAQNEINSHLGGSNSSQKVGSSMGSGMNGGHSQNNVEVSNNQVNVMAIRESRSAVFYKNERIPKAGYDLDGNQVSEEKKREQVKGIMDRIIQMDDYWSVVYRAEGEEKKRIAVFSDPTCPYCQKLHEYVPELQEAGVTVYHLFYNRSMAPNTLGDPKVVRVNEALENAWCSTNPNEAIDSLYEGYSIPPASCSSDPEKIEFPGNEHYLMGRIIDMAGTPYTITEDGLIVTGFDVQGGRQPQSFLRSIGL